MKKYILVALVIFGSITANAQSMELMKLCGEYSIFKDIEKTHRRGKMTDEAKREFAPQKKEFQKKVKEYEKTTGEKFSEKICKDYDLL